MLKQFKRQTKKAKRRVKELPRRKLAKLKPVIEPQRSSTLTQGITGSATKTVSREVTGSNSFTYPDCRFLESPFGALFIPPVTLKKPQCVPLRISEPEVYCDQAELVTCCSK